MLQPSLTNDLTEAEFAYKYSHDLCSGVWRFSEMLVIMDTRKPKKVAGTADTSMDSNGCLH